MRISRNIKSSANNNLRWKSVFIKPLNGIFNIILLLLEMEIYFMSTYIDCIVLYFSEYLHNIFFSTKSPVGTYSEAQSQ